MIHIVFNEADIEVLQKSLDMDETLRGEIIQVKDDFAVGPLKDIYTREGIEARKQWWREVLEGGDYDGLVDTGRINDENTVQELTLKLKDPHEIVWIWAAQNKHDVCGYYWLVSQLQSFHGSICILYLHNLPFLNDKGQVFYPVQLSGIPPKEFLKAKKLARTISIPEFEADSDEWKRLCDENRGVRILDGGKKLVQYDYEFYDSELLKFIGDEWLKVSKLFQQYFSKSSHLTGDAFLLWRLKKMIAAQHIDARGEIRNIKDFEVKRKAL